MKRLCGPTGRALGAAPVSCHSLPATSNLRPQRRPLAVSAHASDSSGPQQPPQAHTRRAALLGALMVALPLPASPAHAAPSDLAQGISNWMNIATSYYSTWVNGQLQRSLQQDSQRRQDQRFGDIAVPGSFTFLHGILVGGLVFVLITYDKLAAAGELPRQRYQKAHSRSESSQHSGLMGAASSSSSAMGNGVNPVVEAALHELIARPSTAAFSDPAVHCAFEDIRADIRNIAKYRNDAVVMQAFEELLEIEGILEKL